jgi:lysozyme
MIRGIDVSKWQGTIDWDKVSKSTSFAIIKSTEGSSYKDPMFIRNRDEARRVGIAHGFYHFANPDTVANDPEREAEFFVATIGTLQVGEVLALDLGRDLVVAELPAELASLLTAREVARSTKNWSESDRLRNELESAGLVINDTADGQEWEWR